VNLTEISFECVDWIHVARYRVR